MLMLQVDHEGGAGERRAWSASWAVGGDGGVLLVGGGRKKSVLGPVNWIIDRNTASASPLIPMLGIIHEIGVAEGRAGERRARSAS